MQSKSVRTNENLSAVMLYKLTNNKFCANGANVENTCVLHLIYELYF